MNMNKRLVLGLGSVAAVLAIGGATLVSGFAINQRSEVQYMTDGPGYQDVTDLTKASKDVAHVRFLSAGKSYLIPFDNATTEVAPARQDGGPKGTAPQQTSITPGLATPKGVLKTDFTAEVLDNVRGADLKKGQHIVITQVGGTIVDQGADGKPANVTVANAEHDPQMQIGDEEVLFLNLDAASGKFFTTGGGQGRFKVQQNGAVMAVDHDSPLGRIQNGKPASFLKSAVQAAR